MERLLENFDWVRALAHSLVSDPEEADDIVQDTWLAALHDGPRDSDSHRPWLRRVLRNFAYFHFRSRRRRAARERLAASSEAVSGPEESVERFEVLRRVVDLVLDLDEKYKTVVVLRYFEGLTGPQIAERLGISRGAARMRLKRALDLLRERLDRLDGGRADWRALLLPAAISAGATGAARASSASSASLAAVPVRAAVARSAGLVFLLGTGMLGGWLLRDIGSPPSSPIRRSADDVASDGSSVGRLERLLETTRVELAEERRRLAELLLRLSAGEERLCESCSGIDPSDAS